MLKKHPFIKWLIILASILMIFHLISLSVDREMARFATACPIVFDEPDASVDHAYGTFTVPTEYDYNGKKYKVTWTSKKKNLIEVKDGIGTIKRENRTQKTVRLTETYRKWFLWKAKREYDLTIPPVSSANDITAVSLEDIRNGNYSKNITVYMDDSQEVKSIYGEFPQTLIVTPADAMEVILTYKKSLGIPDHIQFTYHSYQETGHTGVYRYNCTINGAEINAADILLTVKDGNLVKITNNIPSKLLTQHTSISAEDNQGIVEQYLIAMGETQEYVMDHSGLEIYDDKLCDTYTVLFRNLKNRKIYIEIESRTVTADVDLTFDAYEIDQVQCSGKNEKGEELQFTANKGSLLTDKYSLYDHSRGIIAMSNEALWLSTKAKYNSKDAAANKEPVKEYIYDLANLFLLIPDLTVGSKLNLDVTSETTCFDDPVAVEAYCGIQKAYDYFHDTFGRRSYDGRGAFITLITDYEQSYDNAAWNGSEFIVTPQRKYRYSAAVNDSTLGHEYTHAVFGQFANGTSEELRGANEGYADVFGCLLAPEDDWKIGSNIKQDGTPIVLRDIRYFNTEETANSGKKYPTYYKEENWTGEEHNISVLISHPASMMYDSSLFSEDDIAEIYYHSLAYGLNSGTNYLAIRRNLIQAAEQLGYDKPHLDFIANAFDLEHIYDTNYVKTTNFTPDGLEISEEVLDIQKIPEAENNEEVLQTETRTLPGDWMNDNTEKRLYLVAFSPIGLITHQSAISIYEAGPGLGKEELERRNRILNENTPYEKLQTKYDYRTMNRYVLMAAKKLCESLDLAVTKGAEKAISEFGEMDEKTNTIMRYVRFFAFQWFICEETPYNFYKMLHF